MIVAAHGDVDKYCEEHGMTIGERYTGKVEDYHGSCVVLVTDNCEDQNDYYYQKYRLMRRKIELVSTHWGDASVEDFVRYLSQQEKSRKKYGGRLPYGLKRVGGEVIEDPEAMKVVRRIIELRDAGTSFREIAEEVRRPDGREIPVSSIQVILKNRKKYE